MIEKIRSKMEQKGLSLTKMSQMTGIPKSTLSRYLNGAVEPKTEALKKIAAALDVDVNWLTGTDNSFVKLFYSLSDFQQGKIIQEMLSLSGDNTTYKLLPVFNLNEAGEITPVKSEHKQIPDIQATSDIVAIIKFNDEEMAFKLTFFETDGVTLFADNGHFFQGRQTRGATALGQLTSL